nr:UDP-glucose 4-epimerase [Candidatus Pantoea persica]
MLQEIVNRLSGVEARAPLVICNEEHRFLVAEQLRQIKKLSHNIILEPVGRNTAPAIALAAINVVEQGDDPVLLVLAADHVIDNRAASHDAIKTATKYAKQGHHLVTLGIVPTGPETGYSYIHRGKQLPGAKDAPFGVQRFIDKPNLSTAQDYLASGEYYWDSGMFMFSAKRYLQKLKNSARIFWKPAVVRWPT